MNSPTAIDPRTQLRMNGWDSQAALASHWLNPAPVDEIEFFPTTLFCETALWDAAGNFRTFWRIAGRHMGTGVTVYADKIAKEAIERRLSVFRDEPGLITLNVHDIGHARFFMASDDN